MRAAGISVMVLLLAAGAVWAIQAVRQQDIPTVLDTGFIHHRHHLVRPSGLDDVQRVLTSDLPKIRERSFIPIAELIGGANAERWVESFELDPSSIELIGDTVQLESRTTFIEVGDADEATRRELIDELFRIFEASMQESLHRSVATSEDRIKENP